MRDQPEPTEEEQDQAPERLPDEEATSGEGHEDPPFPPEEPIHEA